MPRNPERPFQVPTIDCCGHFPVMERVGSGAHQVVCAFCRRRGPMAIAQNRARELWNQMMGPAAAAKEQARAIANADPELRQLVADRVARYQRGELSWQAREVVAPAVHLPLTTVLPRRRRRFA